MQKGTKQIPENSPSVVQLWPRSISRSDVHPIIPQKCTNVCFVVVVVLMVYKKIKEKLFGDPVEFHLYLYSSLR